MSMAGIVEWTELCGNGSEFWNSQLTLNTSNPDLTSCFQATILVWVPSAILWLCAVFYLPFLCHKPSVNGWRHKSVINWIKLVTGVALLAISLAELIYIINPDDRAVPLAVWLRPPITAVTLVIVLLLTHLEFSRGYHTSGVLFPYWLLVLLLGIVPFRSRILTLNEAKDISFSFITFYISYGLIIIQVLLTLIPDLSAVEKNKRLRELSEEEKPLLGEARNRELKKKQDKKLCPESRCTFLANITHWWILRLMFKGWNQTLVDDDYWDILDRDKCSTVNPVFKKHWDRKAQEYRQQKHSHGGKNKVPPKVPSLLLALIKTNCSVLLIGAGCRALRVIFDFLNPFLLQYTINFVSGSNPLSWQGYALATALLVVNLLKALTGQLSYKYGAILGMRLRTAVITSVYRKSLRLSSAARQTTTVGEIVNLMSVDAQKLQNACTEFHDFWAFPVTVVVGLALLWQVMGLSTLAGIIVLILILPINGGALTRFYIKYQGVQMQQKDNRLKLVNEILAGIKVLKMYAWEPSFSDKVKEVRQKELDCVQKQAYLMMITDSSFLSASYLVSLAVFSTYVLSSLDNHLTPQKAFVSLNLIQMVNWGASFLAIYATFMAQAYISVQRVGKMLLQDEIDEDAVSYSRATNDQHTAVQVNACTFSWDKDSRHVLQDVDLTVGKNDLTAVVGQVGAGKSSLIAAICGELNRVRGKITVTGSLAYVPQQAWIRNATLRDNILFGKPFQHERYDHVLEACALGQDIAMLPAGDATEIGEKGINLSGGQKQRVSLARAVYQNCDIYLLDDPLSAVDAHVGKHIFENVIGPKGLIRNKARLLVTHSVRYLPEVDNIMVLSDGSVSESGTFQSLLQQKGPFSEIVTAYLTETQDVEEDGDAKESIRRQVSAFSGDSDPGLLDQHTLENIPSKLRRRRNKLSRSCSSRSTHSGTIPSAVKEPESEGAKLIEEEMAESGTVKAGVIYSYMRAMGARLMSAGLISMLLLVVMQIGANIWLSQWSDDPVLENVSEAKKQTDLRLGVYGALGLGQLFGVLGVSITVMTAAVKASAVLHERLLDRVLHAPMSFFDTTPLGRVVNRFSTDMDKVDYEFPLHVKFQMFDVAVILGCLALITYSTPMFIIVLVPLVIVHILIQTLYLRTARQLQRLDAIKRSPIYMHFDETLAGASSVRAYRAQETFVAKNDRLVDESQMAWYSIVISQRWISFVLETLAAVVIFFSSLFAVMERDSLSGGLAGLSISFAMQASIFINFVALNTATLGINVVSLERVKEYTEIDVERPWHIEDKELDHEWPAEGVIAFENYCTRYRPGLDLVLSDLTFSISPGESVGIVGRTGAGKSSMALSLFRIIEAAGGQITIDGVNISNIGLHDLRGRLTIIPQDPVVFSGTIRNNLDPFCKHSDDELWEALRHAHLKSFVANLSNKLGYECGEGGDALSIGQRQLVCLARALLRKSKILVLDEATAAVDMETDDLIQNTIRTEFKGCTVLTVAHRLNTILDYDRVMVLDQGQVKEFDCPSSLLNNTQSLFYNMAKDAGIVVN